MVLLGHRRPIWHDLDSRYEVNSVKLTPYDCTTKLKLIIEKKKYLKTKMAYKRRWDVLFLIYILYLTLIIVWHMLFFFYSIYNFSAYDLSCGIFYLNVENERTIELHAVI